MEAVLERKVKPFKSPCRVGFAPVESVGVAPKGSMNIEEFRAEAKQSLKAKISPLVQSFSINGISVPDDFDYKKALADAINEKHV